MSDLRGEIMVKKILPLLICIVMMTLCSCGQQNSSKEHQFADEYKEFGRNMLVLGVVNESEPTENGVVYLDAINDNLTVQFANLTGSNSEYILKMFVDYEETPFLYQGEYLKEYVFDVTAGSSVELPVSLPPEVKFDNSRILTVAILTAPNKHACDIELMSNSYGVVLSYELAHRDQPRKIEIQSIPVEAEKYMELSFQGVMLNTDYKTDDNSVVRFPPKEITVQPGEEVCLAYRVGNYENTDDLLFVLLVDWAQQPVNNEPYIHLVNKTGYMGYGTINFTAPTTAGKYEIVSFVVDNPSSEKNGDTFHTHETSYRFTLIVE